MSDVSTAANVGETQAEAPKVEGTVLNQPVETKVESQETEAKEGEQKSEETKKDAAPELKVEDLKFPEGFKADPQQLKDFATLLTNPEIQPKEKAQAFIDIHTKALQDASEAASKTWSDVNTKWIGDMAADKEIGTGDPKKPLKPEVASAISKVIDQFGGTELRQMLDLTGTGNNPVLARAFYKISKLTVEGPHVQGTGPAPNKPKGVSAAALYPDLPEG